MARTLEARTRLSVINHEMSDCRKAGGKGNISLMRPKPLQVHDENGPLEKLLNVAEIAPGRISELCRGR